LTNSSTDIEATTTRPVVLLISADRDLTEILEYKLRCQGYEVVTAHDGQEGLRQARTLLPDLILLELMLPTLGGLKICRELRSGERTRRLPILMLTARGEETDQVVRASVGPDDYVTKPFGPDVLLHRLDALQRRAQGNPESDDVLMRLGHDGEPIAYFSEAIRRDPNVAVFYQIRGQQFLYRKDYDRAIADFTEAIRLYPADPEVHNLRANAYYFRGNRAEALAGHLEALARAPDDAGTNNYVAWLLATSPDDHLRDGPRAVELATQACKLIRFRLLSFLDTLAAAWAECGRFDKAAEWAEQAVEQSEGWQAADYRARLELYRVGRPFREGSCE
jgi:CheY-like chemotaxis protein